jgi:hypothetical protein
MKYHSRLLLRGTLIETVIKSIIMNKTFLTLLVGIGIGILVAPAKGSETWRKLVDGLDEYKDKLSNEGADIVDKGKDVIKRGKSKVQGIVNDVETNPAWNG